jgi:HEXXH motif-containing protein
VTPGQHEISADLLRAMAQGGGGAALREVLVSGQRSKCRLLVRGVVDGATSGDHAEAPMAVSGYELLARVQRQAPQAVERVLRHPAVGAWALQAVLRMQSAASRDASPGRLASVAAAAAISGNVACEIMLPAADSRGMIVLPSLGGLQVPETIRGDVVRLRSGPGRVELHGPRGTVHLAGDLGAAPGWRPIRAVTLGPVTLGADITGAGITSAENGRISMLFDDVDPYQFSGYAGPFEYLSGNDLAAWRQRLGGGWQILVRHHPGTAADVRAFVATISPLPAPSHGQVSASSRQAFGCVALSLPADDVSMALALAHEVQHAKLAALMDLLPMLAVHGYERFYAPWRDDPRPLAGLLHGVYAHVGVAGFWRHHRYIARGPAEVIQAHTEFARWRTAARQVAEFLGTRPELTPGGRVFVAGMAQLLRAWQLEFVPAAALANADRAARNHRASWLRRHGAAAG